MQTRLKRSPSERERIPNKRVDARLSPDRSFDVNQLADAFRRGKAARMSPQRDAYVTSLAGRIEDGEVRVFDHLVICLRNWFERGAPQEHVEAVFHAGLSMVRRWYGARGVTDDLETLVRNETIAQAHADVTQWDLARATSKEIAEAEAALSVHLIQLTRLVLRLRAIRYAEHALPPAA